MRIMKSHDTSDIITHLMTMINASDDIYVDTDIRRCQEMAYAVIQLKIGLVLAGYNREDINEYFENRAINHTDEFDIMIPSSVCYGIYICHSDGPLGSRIAFCGENACLYESTCGALYVTFDDDEYRDMITRVWSYMKNAPWFDVR